jgi:hypothetical protein
MRKGKNLELLITAIEKTLSKDKSITIESPKRLRDRTTGKLREHDVVLTIKQGHHSLLMAIECRDHSRPITVNQVEAFSQKCRDTGINQGVIVSSHGFYNTARTKAAHLGIRCLNIDEVTSFKWLLASGIHAINVKLLNTDWIFYPEKDGVVGRSRFELLDSNETTVSKSVLTANAQDQLNKLLPHLPAPVEEAELTVRFESCGLILRDINTGLQVPVKFAIAKIKYSVTQELIPFRLFQYIDKKENKDKSITDAAVAHMNFGAHSGNLTIIYKEDKGGQIFFMPESKKKKRLIG